MATVEYDPIPIDPLPGSAPPANGGHKKQMHRLDTVRRQQGMSLRSVARQMGCEVSLVKGQAEESADLRLSVLHRWQAVLDVPLVDLLVDPGTPLSRPVLERAQLVRLMKTAAALLEKADSVAIRRMAQMLVDQLVEIMPELSQIGPWHNVGQRRSMTEYGRVVERCLSEDYLFHPPHE